jgi:CubicO group peptidase (beta-lactamase class C family)
MLRIFSSLMPTLSRLNRFATFGLGSAFATFLLCWSAFPAAGDDRFPDAAWEHVAPESEGWSTDRLKQAEEWSQHIGSTAVMVIHHGTVVAEWGDVAAKTPLASVRKSLLSALFGIAVERGEISLTKTIGELGIDDNEPSLSAEEKTATVGDLLKARSGIYHSALFETPDMTAKRPARYSHKPGTFWYYNNWDFNALGAIYEHAVRHSIFDAIEHEIARPVGMEDYKTSDGEYVTGTASVYPAYPIKMSARDLARFALLYLNKGKWHDRQIIPANWVDESTQSYSEADYAPGYGYLWWIGFNNSLVPTVKLPPGAFSARGFGGQYAFVIPAFDLVLVHRAARFQDGGPNFREFGRLLWLVLDAGHFPDIGPDASIEEAQGKHLGAAALKEFVAGKTLLYGEAASSGPYRIHLDPDGSAAALRGRDPIRYDMGSWRIDDDDRLCREWQKTRPLRLCWTVIANGSHVALFDENGLLYIDAQLTE